MSDSATPWTYSLPGSSVHGILQAIILGWVVISFSRGSSPPRDPNPSLLYWQADYLPPRHLGSHRIIEVQKIPFLKALGLISPVSEFRIFSWNIEKLTQCTQHITSTWVQGNTSLPSIIIFLLKDIHIFPQRNINRDYNWSYTASSQGLYQLN